MIWSTRKIIKQKKNLSEWHIWFAWYPVKIDEFKFTINSATIINKRWAWFCNIERKLYNNWGDGFKWKKWDYIVNK